MRLLAKYSVAGGGGGFVVPGSTVEGVILVGAEEGTGVTRECGKEAAGALSAMMSERVPRRDRALALAGLLAEVRYV